MSVVQAAVIGLVALILAPGYFFYFDVTPKLAVLLAGAAVFALFWKGQRPARPFTLIILLTAVSLAVSSAISSNPPVSLFGSTWRRFGSVAQVAVLLVAWLVAGNGYAGRINVLRGIAIASAIAALYGVAQYFGWDPFLPGAGYHIGEGKWTIVRPPGTMGYVSYFATWLLMSGFLCVSLAGCLHGVRWKRLSYACAVLCFVAMLLTGTRAALAGFGAGAAVLVLSRRFRLPRRLIAGAAGIVLAGTVFYFSPPGWALRSRTRWFAEDPWGGARPLLWRDSIRMGSKRLAAGFGPETFTAEFPRFESKELARAYPDFAHESPHNIFLDALVSQGLPGLACLVAFCALGLRSAWLQKQTWTAAALVSGIVAQQFTAFTIPTALLFYVTAALWVPREEARCGVWWRLPALAAATVMAYCCLRYAAADRSLELARRSIEARDIPAAATHYRDYERRRFPGATADLWYSRALLSARAVIPAGQAALAATRTAEDPFNAWYNLAEIYAIGNSAGDTERCLRAASAANPNWFKPHWMLARLLGMEGRGADASAEAAIASDLDGGKHPEVNETLETIRPAGR